MWYLSARFNAKELNEHQTNYGIPVDCYPTAGRLALCTIHNRRFDGFGVIVLVFRFLSGFRFFRGLGSEVVSQTAPLLTYDVPLRDVNDLCEMADVLLRDVNNLCEMADVLLRDVNDLCAFRSVTINSVNVSRDGKTARTLKVSTEEAVRRSSCVSFCRYYSNGC